MTALLRIHIGIRIYESRVISKYSITSAVLKVALKTLSTSNVIWTLGGGGGVYTCDVSRWKTRKISIVCSNFLIFWNHVYKVHKIQHFHECICILSIYFYAPLSGSGLAPSVLNLKACKINNASGASQSRKKSMTFLRGGWRVSRKTSIWRFSWTKSICDASLNYKYTRTITPGRQVFLVLRWIT